MPDLKSDYKKRNIVIILILYVLFSWLLAGVFAYKLGIFADIKSAIIQVMNNNKQDNEESGSFKPYMRKLQRDIRSNWHPPAGKTGASVVVFFKILKNGNIASVEIIQYSGNADVDNTALEALYKTAPFRPLPAFYDKDSVDVVFTFDYKVHN